MIERKFIDDKKKEFEISKFIEKKVKRAGFSSAKLIKTPLGDKIIVAAMKPGIVVGPKGKTIKSLTDVLKTKYKLENPQIEVEEVKGSKQNPKVMANFIVFALERYGMKGYKSAVYRALRDVMGSGAIGIEIVISGKIPSSRSRSWKFKDGYFKKSGDIALNKVKRAIVQAKLKTGVVGIKVSILPGDVIFPDKMTLKDIDPVIIEEFVDKNGEVVKKEVDVDYLDKIINKAEVSNLDKKVKTEEDKKVKVNKEAKTETKNDIAKIATTTTETKKEEITTKTKKDTVKESVTIDDNKKDDSSKVE